MRPEIKKLSDDVLISEVKRLVAEERKITADLLHHLCEVQRRRLFAVYGYPSLFKFCVHYLKFTEGQTQRRLEAMRAMLVMPEIEEKIIEGSLFLTSVAQAQSYFKSQEKLRKPVTLEVKKEVLLTLENKSTRECEKELLKLGGEARMPREKIKPLSETHSQASMNLTNEVLLKLERIRSLLSHKNPNMNQSELIDEMAEITLDKIDPLRKKERKPTQRSVSPARIVRNQILKRDQGRCIFISPITNQRCDSTFLLEVDHVHPKGLGGESTPENARLLCKAHNQRSAIEIYGIGKMDPFINVQT